MNNFHPSPGAGDGSRELKNSTSAPYEKKEEIFQCPHCGLPNDGLSVTIPDPNGDSNKILAVRQDTLSGTKTVYEKKVTAGCRLCGLHPQKSDYTRPLFSTINLQGR